MKFFSISEEHIRGGKAAQFAIEDGYQRAVNYDKHLQALLGRLPEATRQFASSAWYHLPSYHDCPHDGWLLEFRVTVDPSQPPVNAVTLRLLGAYHDRILSFRYTNVVELKVDLCHSGQKTPLTWLRDEIDIVGNGFVSHDILWNAGIPWTIVAEKIELTIEDYVP